MGVTRDFVAATIADALLPTFRRSIEDIIYEALDRRQIPTRTDFKELRDLANTLRGQVNGAIQNLRSIADQQEAIEERFEEYEQESDSDSESDDTSALTAIQKDLRKIKEFDPSSIEKELKQLTEQLTELAQKFEALAQQDALIERLEQLETQQLAQQKHIQRLEEALKSSKRSKAKAKCSVPGCTNQARARGLCGSHYKQFSRNTLAGYVNKKGFFMHEGKRYQAAKKYEASPFSVEGDVVVIKEDRFPLSSLEKPAKPDS